MLAIQDQGRRRGVGADGAAGGGTRQGTYVPRRPLQNVQGKGKQMSIGIYRSVDVFVRLILGLGSFWACWGNASVEGHGQACSALQHVAE